MSRKVVKKFIRRATGENQQVAEAAVTGFYAALQVKGIAVPLDPEDGEPYTSWAIAQAVAYDRGANHEAEAAAVIVRELREQSCIDKRGIVTLPEGAQTAPDQQTVTPGCEPLPETTQSPTDAPDQGVAAKPTPAGTYHPNLKQAARLAADRTGAPSGQSTAATEDGQKVWLPTTPTDQEVERPATDVIPGQEVEPKPTNDESASAQGESSQADRNTEHPCDECGEDAMYCADQADKRRTLVELVGMTHKTIGELALADISDDRLSIALDAIQGTTECAIGALYPAPTPIERHVHYHVTVDGDEVGAPETAQSLVEGDDEIAFELPAEGQAD